MLYEKLPIHFCPQCDRSFTHPDTDPYGYDFCPHCGAEAEEPTSEVIPRYWMVAVYDFWQAYGGPEEGGWWYTEGTLTDHHLLRGFDDYGEAHRYLLSLRDFFAEDRTVTVRGYTEQLPPQHFPECRPRYC